MASRREWLLGRLADGPVLGAALLTGLHHREKRLMRQALFRLVAEGAITITRREAGRETFATALVQQVLPGGMQHRDDEGVVGRPSRHPPQPDGSGLAAGPDPGV